MTQLVAMDHQIRRVTMNHQQKGDTIMKIAIAVAALLWALPVAAQTEVAVSATGAWSSISDVLTYSQFGVAVEAARYTAGGKIGITGELGYATGPGTFIYFRFPNDYQTKLALAGVRVRFPGKVTPSLRVAAGLAVLEQDERRNGLPKLYADLFALAVGGAVDFAVAPEMAVRVQPEMIHLSGFGNLWRVSSGLVVKW